MQPCFPLMTLGTSCLFHWIYSWIASLMRRYWLYSGFLSTVDNGKVSGNGRISPKTSNFWRWNRKWTKLFHCPHFNNVISILLHHVTSYVFFPKCIHSCKINHTMSRGTCRELHFRLSCNHNVRLYSVLPDNSFWSCFRETSAHLPALK